MLQPIFLVLYNVYVRDDNFHNKGNIHLGILTVVYLQPMKRVVHCSVGKKRCIAVVSYNVCTLLYPTDPLQYKKDFYHCQVHWGPLTDETNSDPFRISIRNLYSSCYTVLKTVFCVTYECVTVWHWIPSDAQPQP